MNPLPSRIVAVTDRTQSTLPLDRQVAMVLQAGIRWIWLRDRDLPPDERRRVGEALRDVVVRAGAVLTVGADIGLAASLDAAGVHLPRADGIAEARRRLGPSMLVGVSSHSPADVAEAARQGADYATLSPIFATPSKPGYGPALGPAALTAAASFGIPVLALGGVSARNADACLAAGAAGLAIMGALMRASTPDQVALAIPA